MKRFKTLLLGLFVAVNAAAEPLPVSTSTSTPTSTQPPASLVVPAGTVLTIRFDEDVTSRQPSGYRFTTTLETNLLVGTDVAVPAGTKVYGVIAASKEQ